MALIKEQLDPKTIEWLNEWKQKNQNHKLDQPKNWYKNVKDVVRNITTKDYSKENVSNV